MLHIMRTIVYIRFKYGNKQGKRKKIKLEKHDSSTRSATSTLVEAYADDYIVSVSVENYTGDIYVQVYGAGGGRTNRFFRVTTTERICSIYLRFPPELIL